MEWSDLSVWCWPPIKIMCVLCQCCCLSYCVRDRFLVDFRFLNEHRSPFNAHLRALCVYEKWLNLDERAGLRQILGLSVCALQFDKSLPHNYIRLCCII